MAEVLLLHVLTQGSQSLRARAAELCAARNVLVDPSAPSEGGEGSPPQGGAPGGAVRLSTEDRRRLLGVLCVPPSPRGAKDVWGDLTEAGDAGGALGGASGAADELLYQLERPGDEHMYMAGLWESEARAAYAGRERPAPPQTRTVRGAVHLGQKQDLCDRLARSKGLIGRGRPKPEA